MKVRLPALQRRFQLGLAAALLSLVGGACAPRETPTSQARPADRAPTQASADPAPVRGADGGKWDAFALLLIDVQSDFWDAAAATQQREFPANVKEMLQTCRSEGIEVIHVRSEFAPDGSDWPDSFKAIFSSGIPCVRGTDGARAAAFAAETSEERVFVKQSFDGFSNADLVDYLRSRGKKHLLVAGLTTDLCVLSTALSAVNRGHLVTLVSDCCAAPLPAAHNFVVGRYGNFIFSTVGHDDLVAQLPAWHRQLEALERPQSE